MPLNKCSAALLLILSATICNSGEPTPGTPTKATELVERATSIPATPTAKNPANLLPMPKGPIQAWITSLDRLRKQPAAAEISNGTTLAALTDIFESGPEAKSRSKEISKEYEMALVEKVAKWELELIELRSQHEARMVLELPLTKRESAQKFLDLSHTKWSESATRDAKLRIGYLERLRGIPRPQSSPTKPPVVNASAAQNGIAASGWMRDERLKSAKQDEEFVKSLREILTPDEAARFDRFTHVRASMPPSFAPQTPATPPVPVPPIAAPVAESIQSTVPKDILVKEPKK